MTKIKSLNEYFSQTLSGDSFNSSNGVFKVNYKAYSDLSIAVGRDADPSLLVKDSAFQVGDIVKGKVHGIEKKVKGEIIETTKALDGKSYTIKIQGLKNKKTYKLIPGSVEFIQDRGHSRNTMGMTISSREKNAQNLKYDAGNIVWGSLENRTIDPLYANIEDSPITGPMGTGWLVQFVDDKPEGDTIFNSLFVDPNKNILTCPREEVDSYFMDKLKAAEAFCFIFYNPELQDLPEDLRSLIAIIFLEMKNEMEAKKHLIKNFSDLNQRSYGESRDEHLDKAKEIINSFL